MQSRRSDERGNIERAVAVEGIGAAERLGAAERIGLGGNGLCEFTDISVREVLKEKSVEKGAVNEFRKYDKNNECMEHISKKSSEVSGIL